jgi:hypothetical protein
MPVPKPPLLALQDQEMTCAHSKETKRRARDKEADGTDRKLFAVEYQMKRCPYCELKDGQRGAVAVEGRTAAKDFCAAVDKPTWEELGVFTLNNIRDRTPGVVCLKPTNQGKTTVAHITTCTCLDQLGTIIFHQILDPERPLHCPYPPALIKTFGRMSGKMLYKLPDRQTTSDEL